MPVFLASLFLQSILPARKQCLIWKKIIPENVFLMMGLHPTYVKDNYLEELQHVESELAKRKFYAVGEIGIDLFWDKTHLKEQQIAFRKQIQLAKQYKLPIVIHCRDAFDEIFKVLEEEKSPDLFGIFHCFTERMSRRYRRFR
jgi:TatD DNase family protein